MRFSQRALELFRRQLYQGLTFKPDSLGMTGSFGTGRFAVVAIRCDGGRIAEARHETMNCTSAIAAADWACEWARGLCFSEVAMLQTQDVLEALDGLPERREFCSRLVADALLIAAREARQKGLLL